MSTIEWNGYLWTKVVLDNLQEDDIENNLPPGTLLVNKEGDKDSLVNDSFDS